MIISKIILLFLLTLVGFFSCTNSPMGSIAGGSGSDVEARAACITGTIVDSTGTPQANATVRLRPEDYLSGETVSTSAGKLKQVNTVTDTAGAFSIDSVDSGRYVIEVLSGDTLGVIIMCEVFPGDTVKNVEQSTVMPMATISGYIDIENSDPSEVTVRLYGLDHVTHPDSNGHFDMRVPYGHYRLAIDADSYAGRHEDSLEVYSGGSYMYERSGSSEPCEDWQCDSLFIGIFLRRVVNSTIPVDSVVVKRDDRVVGLNLRGLGLTHISPMLNNLTALEQLDCGNNRLEDISTLHSLLPQLQVIKLDSNKLVTLPEDIGTFERLEVLDISENNIGELPSSIVNCSLTELNISGNELCDLPYDVAQWLTVQVGDFGESQRCDSLQQDMGKSNTGYRYQN